MTKRAAAPDRGELVWIDFSPQSGHEQAGRRPAFVVSPRSYNAAAGLAIVCPVTSRVKGYSFEVLLPAGLPIEGVVLADQAKSIDWDECRMERAGVAPPAVTSEVLRKLSTLVR